MASGDGNSWWNNLVKSAKEKSMSALEIIKSDLAEFTTTMTNDTTNLLNQASAHLIQTTNSAALFLNNSESTNSVSSDLESKQLKKKNESKNLKSTFSIQDRYNDELKSIQLNEKTYLSDPNTETSSDYLEWNNVFNVETYKSTISDLLIENGEMRLLYSQLVPAQISNTQFWCKYFYKVNQLEEEHKKRIKLLERASDEIKNNNEQSGDWEDDAEETKEVKNVQNEEDIKKNANNSSTTEEETTLDNTLELETDEKSTIENKAADLINKIEINCEENNENIPSAEEKSSDTESSNFDKETNSISSREASIPSKEDNIELSHKTEDSDEWEKVSDVVVSNSDDSKQNKSDKSKTSNSLNGELDNKKKEKSNEKDEWDDWE